MIKPQLEAEFPGFYCGTADLYTYFYKRGLELLKSGGHLCFIAPNKFMRAGYGANTRKLLTTQATPRVIIDFGDTPVFDATTYPSIVLVEKIPPNPPLLKGGDDAVNKVPHFAKGGLGGISVAIIKDAADIERVSEVIVERGFTMKTEDLRAEGWTLESPAVQNLLNKLRQVGVPLGGDGLFVGVKTGLNEAFLIDDATRERLVAEDPNSAKLIKPWLRGRDIRKWKAEWAGLYIIAIVSGTNHAWPWSKAKSEAEARRIFTATYPAIHAHLSQWEDKLRMRDDQGQYWWELRSCAYYVEFEKLKIVVPDLSPSPRFAIERKGFFPDMTAFVLSSSDPYLLGILNSKLMEFFFLKISASVRGETFRFKKQYMEQLPIFPATDAQKSPITQRVQTILANPSSPDVPRLEAEVNELVFELYNLTKTERQLVLAARAESCEDEIAEENHDDSQSTSTTRSTPKPVAGKPRRRGKPAGGISPTGAEIHPEFDGAGKRAG